MRQLFTFLILTGAAFAQGGLYNDTVFDSTGRPASGATVRVCTSTATGTTCTPTASIYSDNGLSVPIVGSTVTADAQGNFNFFAQPGVYKAQACKSGNCYTYLISVPPDVTANGAGRLAQLGYKSVTYDFGALCDGSTDDTAAFVAAAASTAKVIVVPYSATTCNVAGSTLGAITGVANQTWINWGATIKNTAAGKIVFNFTDVDGWSLQGNWKLQGVNGGTVGTPSSEALLYIAGGHNWSVDHVYCTNSNGWCVKNDPGLSLTPRGDKGHIGLIEGKNNYTLFENTVGTGSEYVTIGSIKGSLNTFPLIIAAGNTVVNSCTLTDNTNGVYIGNGSNHAHGRIANCESNHNTNYNWKFDQVTNGMNIVNSSCYGDSPTTGIMWFNASSGINWIGGSIDCQIKNDSVAGRNSIVGAFMPTTTGSTTANGTSGETSMEFSHNILPAGDWGRNNRDAQRFVGDGATISEIGSLGVNTLTRGLKFTDSAGATSVLIEDVPNTVGTNSILNLYVGGNAAGDMKLSVDDNGAILMPSGGSLGLGGGTPIKKYVEGTVTVDLANILANTCIDTAGITVTGALDGDLAVGSALAAVASVSGLQITAYVSASDTAKVRVCNVTAGAIDPASTTYRVGVWVH